MSSRSTSDIPNTRAWRRAEERIRTKLLTDGHIDTVISHGYRISPDREDLEAQRLFDTTPNFYKLRIDSYLLTKPGLVIDGQHRLLGMNEYDPALQVNVVAILGANDMEKAFQFLVINNKATKVSMDHIRALALHYEEAALKTRLETARLTLDPNVGYVGLVNNEEDSPFRGIVSWPLTPERDRIVVPASVEASIGLIQQQKVREFESEDVLLEFFYTIWRTIKARWPDLWGHESRLLGKVGVICMTQYMTDALIASYDLGRLNVSDPGEVAKLVEELLAHQERTFWKVPWTSTSYDTKVGRTLVVASLVQIARNIRAGVSWYEDVELVDPGNLE